MKEKITKKEVMLGFLYLTAFAAVPLGMVLTTTVQALINPPKPNIERIVIENTPNKKIIVINEIEYSLERADNESPILIPYHKPEAETQSCYQEIKMIENQICEWGVAALDDKERIRTGAAPKNFGNSAELTKCYDCHIACQLKDDYSSQRKCTNFTYFEKPKSDKQKAQSERK